MKILYPAGSCEFVPSSSLSRNLSMPLINAGISP